MPTPPASSTTTPCRSSTSRTPTSRWRPSFNGVQAFPTTAFYDSKGELAFVHQGGYASEAKLAEDIDKYAR